MQTERRILVSKDDDWRRRSPYAKHNEHEVSQFITHGINSRHCRAGAARAGHDGCAHASAGGASQDGCASVAGHDGTTGCAGCDRIILFGEANYHDNHCNEGAHCHKYP